MFKILIANCSHMPTFFKHQHEWKTETKFTEMYRVGNNFDTCRSFLNGSESRVLILCNCVVFNITKLLHINWTSIKQHFEII